MLMSEAVWVKGLLDPEMDDDSSFTAISVFRPSAAKAMLMHKHSSNSMVASWAFFCLFQIFGQGCLASNSLDSSLRMFPHVIWLISFISPHSYKNWNEQSSGLGNSYLVSWHVCE